MPRRPPIEDERWMRIALAQARRGEGLTRPNPPVGAVLVRNGRLLGRGFHRRAGRPHAEINALRAAGDAARGATLYVTLEPCSTWGRAPPCTEQIIARGIRRVVIGCPDPNPNHAGRGVRILRRAGLSVTVGVCGPECAGLVAPFHSWITRGLPYVTLKLGASLDGRIADARGRSRWITGPEARREAHRLRRRVDAILVGRGGSRSAPASSAMAIPSRRWSSSRRGARRPTAARSPGAASRPPCCPRPAAGSPRDASCGCSARGACSMSCARGAVTWRPPSCARVARMRSGGSPRPSCSARTENRPSPERTGRSTERPGSPSRM